MRSRIGLSIAILAIAVTPAFSQSIKRVAVHKDWGVFATTSPARSAEFADCWGASEPKASVNTRGGSAVQVRRDETQLMVVFTRGSASPQVTFTGGYPYADGGTVSAVVDGKSFTLVTANEAGAGGGIIGWAWPRDPSDESKIVAAMRRGSEAVITGKSSRGTQTRDTFSLLGFTAAVEAAQRQCAG
jgi:hypothetical protein